MNHPLMLGVAREIITPEVGTHLYGYRPNIVSTSVNDDLVADSYFFSQGEKTALMISATVCSIQTELCDRIRAMLAEEVGIPMELIMLSAIHTHSGPNISGTVGWGDIDMNYVENIFIPGVLKSARRAKESMLPVKVGAAHGDSFVGINRRQLNPDNTISLGQNPWGPFNPKMTVVSFADEAGRVVANMVHYGAHCTASGQNTEITRDWPGVMIDTMETVTGGMTSFFNGPEGDVGPRMANGKTVGNRTVKDALVLGGVAAADAVRIFRQIKAYRDVDLDTTYGSISIPLEKRISREAAQAIYEKFKDNNINNGATQKDHALKVLRSYEEGYVDKETREIPQTIVRIGDVAFVGFIYELFSEIGMRIDQASKIPHVLSVVETNGMGVYLATQDALCRGGYEIIMHRHFNLQPYRDDADHAVVVGTLENLKKIGG